MKTYSYDTVSEAINGLARRGYATDLQILAAEECLMCNKSSLRLSPDEFEIDETYRFEGDTDPGDEMIVFAISSAIHGVKGVVVNGYGVYSNTGAAKIVERLQNHIKTKPIKRNSFLQPLSREHHHALLLCWKIRTGIKKKVEVGRIKNYMDWFFVTHLLPHFEIEESLMFPILGSENNLVKKALSEHRRLKRLFQEETKIEENMSLIEEELESHIRFEERVLFNEIQKYATASQLEAIHASHSDEKFVDNLSDKFWE